MTSMKMEKGFPDKPFPVAHESGRPVPQNVEQNVEQNECTKFISNRFSEMTCKNFPDLASSQLDTSRVERTKL